jgi:hypothetical protein
MEYLRQRHDNTLARQLLKTYRQIIGVLRALRRTATFLQLALAAVCKWYVTNEISQYSPLLRVPVNESIYSGIPGCEEALRCRGKFSGCYQSLQAGESPQLVAHAGILRPLWSSSPEHAPAPRSNLIICCLRGMS